jgi:hypothetical protein
VTIDRPGVGRGASEDRPFIAEDFVFDPGAFTATRDLAAVHEEVFLEETPLAVLRQIHLEHGARPHTAVTLRCALCWNGFRDALTLLERFPRSFQRAIPPNAVVNTAERYGIGDAGVAWAWSGTGEPDVLAFVRNNVYASFTGHDAAEIVRLAARELDEAVTRLRTSGPYADAPTGALDEVRRRVPEVARVASGGRLDLGAVPTDPNTRVFFLSTGGSVNRSPERAEQWYYRAGATKGRHEIVAFRVGRGILPVRERLVVEVE